MPLTYRQPVTPSSSGVATLRVMSLPISLLKSIAVELAAIKLSSNENRWLICSVPWNPVTSRASSASGVVTCNGRLFWAYSAIRPFIGVPVEHLPMIVNGTKVPFVKHFIWACRLTYNGDGAGQLAVIRGAGQAPLSQSFLLLVKC